MKIRRGTNPGDHFTILPRELLQDERLTLRARGLLALLRSYPPGWETTVEALMLNTPEGRYALRTCLRDLCELGLVEQSARGVFRVVIADDPAGVLT